MLGLARLLPRAVASGTNAREKVCFWVHQQCARLPIRSRGRVDTLPTHFPVVEKRFQLQRFSQFAHPKMPFCGRRPSATAARNFTAKTRSAKGGSGDCRNNRCLGYCLSLHKAPSPFFVLPGSSSVTISVNPSVDLSEHFEQVSFQHHSLAARTTTVDPTVP